jgi:hypothetical protein
MRIRYPLRKPEEKEIKKKTKEKKKKKVKGELKKDKETRKTESNKRRRGWKKSMSFLSGLRSKINILYSYVNI